ncbi:MAG TPA: hypothetical protein VNO30_49035 [Kofleriaceae bacterium]|nr:hypothetical protein [Kofleriaceae bacterium]
MRVLAILGIVLSMMACSGAQSGGPSSGLSKDDAVLETVLLHEIAAASPRPDEALCLRVRGGPGNEPSVALLSAIQRRHPRAIVGSACGGGGPDPVRVNDGGGPGIVFDVGPVKWLGDVALIEGGGGSRGGAASVREVEYRVERAGAGYKVVSERVLRQI